MTLWLGVMRLAERSGFINIIARVLRPVLRRLFPDVPEDHPAMGSMVMNIAANVLGLLNAATPLGLRAMRDLERLNPHPGTATNAMCTFLAINTGSVQLIPITAIAVLAAAGSASPYAIVGTSLIATCFSSAAGLIAVKVFERWRIFAPGAPAAQASPAAEPPGESIVISEAKPLSPTRKAVVLLFVLFFAWAGCVMIFPDQFGVAPAGIDPDEQGIVRVVNAISIMAIPFLLAFFPFYAALSGIKVYEEFVEGARDGFNVAVKIIPYLVTMLVAIAMFRGAGGIQILTKWLQPLLQALHFPTDLLPMALMRPLSGSGSLAIFSDIVNQLGPDHLVTRMAATLYGSTETTFYVIAVYFGSIAVNRTRHAIPAGLAADIAGVIAAIVVCRVVFG